MNYMKIFKNHIKLLTFLFLLYAPVFIAFAAGGPIGSGNQLDSPIKAESIQALAADIINIVVKVGAPIVVFFLIYVGFLFVTARGNTETLKTAKNALLWTFIGGLILLGAQGLSSVICGTIDTISNQTTCS